MLRILTLIAALLFAGAASATQTLYVDSPGDGGLNLRSGPSTSYRVIHEMPHGSRVTLYGRKGNWAELRHESGATGWAHAAYLSDHRPAPLASQVPQLQRLYVHAPGHAGLNLRKGPGTHYPVVLTMAQGSGADLLGAQGDWLFVRHVSGATGWAHRAYLAAAREPKPRHTYRPAPRRDAGWGCDRPRNNADWHRCQALRMIDRMDRR